MTLKRQNDITTPTASTITAESIKSPEELDDALKREKLILHFDVDWAIQAVQSRRVIFTFKDAIENDVRYSDVVFRRLDCTDQEGPIWDAIEKWLREQNADQSLMFAGYGAIAWVRSGIMVNAVHYAAQESVDNLVAKTRLAMTTNPRNL